MVLSAKIIIIAPIAQWTEQSFPKRQISVQLWMGVPSFIDSLGTDKLTKRALASFLNLESLFESGWVHNLKDRLAMAQHEQEPTLSSSAAALELFPDSYLAELPELPKSTSIDPIDCYLREISRYPLLSPEEEVILGMNLQAGREARDELSKEADLSEDLRQELELRVAGEERAREILTKSNLRLVVFMAKQHLNRGVLFLDLIQEGNMGLMKAVERFDYKRGYRFSTYATWWIRHAATRAIADQGRTIRWPVHFVEVVSRVNKAARHLTRKLGQEPSPEEIAIELKTSVERVRMIQAQSQSILSLNQKLRDRGSEHDEGETDEFGDFIKAEGPTIEEQIGTDTDESSLVKQVRAMLTTHHLSPRQIEVLFLRYGLEDGCDRTLKQVGEEIGVTRERVRQIEARALKKLRNLSALSEPLRDLLD